MRHHHQDDNGPSPQRPAPRRTHATSRPPRPVAATGKRRAFALSAGRHALWVATAVAFAVPARADEGPSRLAAEVRGGAEGQTVVVPRSAEVASAAEPTPAPAPPSAEKVAPATAPAFSTPAAPVAPTMAPALSPGTATASPRSTVVEVPAPEPGPTAAVYGAAHPSATARPAQDASTPTIYQQFLVDLYASLPPTSPPSPPFYLPSPGAPSDSGASIVLGGGSYGGGYPVSGQVIRGGSPISPNPVRPSGPAFFAPGEPRNRLPRPYQFGTRRSRIANGVREAEVRGVSPQRR